MKAIPTAIPDVLLIEPEVFNDSRGYFYESWNRHSFAELGIDADFVQRMRQLGLEELNVDRLVALKIHNVDADFFNELAAMGLIDLPEKAPAEA